jgi:hypothetical protein
MTSGESPTSSEQTIGPICFVIGGNVGTSKWFSLEAPTMMGSDVQPFIIKSDGFITCFGLSSGTFTPPTSYDLEVYVNDTVTPVIVESIIAQQENIIVNIPVMAEDLVSLRAIRTSSPNASDMYVAMYLK